MKILPTQTFYHPTMNTTSKKQVSYGDMDTYELSKQSYGHYCNIRDIKSDIRDFKRKLDEKFEHLYSRVGDNKDAIEDLKDSITKIEKRLTKVERTNQYNKEAAAKGENSVQKVENTSVQKVKNTSDDLEVYIAKQLKPLKNLLHNPIPAHLMDVEELKEMHKKLADRPDIIEKIHTTKDSRGFFTASLIYNRDCEKNYERVYEVFRVLKDKPKLLAEVFSNGGTWLYIADELIDALKKEPEALLSFNKTKPKDLCSEILYAADNEYRKSLIRALREASYKLNGNTDEADIIIDKYVKYLKENLSKFIVDFTRHPYKRIYNNLDPFLELAESYFKETDSKTIRRFLLNNSKLLIDTAKTSPNMQELMTDHILEFAESPLIKLATSDVIQILKTYRELSPDEFDIVIKKIEKAQENQVKIVI